MFSVNATFDFFSKAIVYFYKFGLIDNFRVKIQFQFYLQQYFNKCNLNNLSKKKPLRPKKAIKLKTTEEFKKKHNKMNIRYLKNINKQHVSQHKRYNKKVKNKYTKVIDKLKKITKVRSDQVSLNNKKKYLKCLSIII